MRLAIVLLLSSLSFAQGMGGKSGIGGKAGFGGGAASSPAAFVNATSCTAAAATCTISGLSIPSADLIVAGCHASGSIACAVSDSNSDAQSYTSQLAEPNGTRGQMALVKAGAAITTFTCTQTAATNIICYIAWYTPGSLTGVIDQSIGQSQPATTNWSSSNTATLTGSNDLVVGFWFDQNTGATSTYSDGGTQRVTLTTPMSSALEDRNVSGTAAVAATGTWTPGGTFGAAMVMAVK